ncbi:MAG: polysaccharide biosynthesis protein [Flavobacteriaceae bacterium]|nr:polysaccharide biosynthesis protein [Flavobacteriaceae bacterium]MBT6354369.1 polysaccharide biosynthesis protein [Pelagibacteraceae bacterium]MBT7624266.1 polysaccharide biosynthesis protein [Flavobacteriaceae bacterium]
MFKNKTLLITGGTGSFGNAVLNRFLQSDIKEIKIFSRDEKKQDDMRRSYKSSKIKFFVGDVRDPLSIDGAMANTDYVFHAAALKQVPSCEFFPVEAVKTNIIGTENVLNSAINNKVEKIICLSTDKAVYPINAMGISKAMMEKVFVAKSRNSGKTKIIGTRYGNVMGSRGSVIPLFIEQIKAGKPITITDPKMTRFMMSLDEAVELVLYAFKNGNQGDLFVQKSPAATVSVLAKALVELYKSKSTVKEIGIRHGEKMYETLVTKEEMIKAEDQEKYFKISPDGRDLNYDQYFSKGTLKSSINEYNSNNTNLLNVEEMKNLLQDLPIIKEEINN